MAAKKEPKLKLRTTFPQELHAEARAEGKGKISITIEFPNGDREERQFVGNANQCRFARWAGVLLSEEQLRDLIDLEEIIRRAVE